MHCTLCVQALTERNTAVFDCGHSFHLSCVLKHPYSSLCANCNTSTASLPDVGLDRQVAVSSAIMSKIQQRQLQPVQARTFLLLLQRVLTPLTPTATCFADHVYHNKRLSYIAEAGFQASDAVQERIPWSDISTRYNGQDTLDFGFDWSHMVSMGITPKQLQSFTWLQQMHNLDLTAEKLLQMNMTINELAAIGYTTHQLVELGFNWQIMSGIGANVETWRAFGFDLVDLKRYWSPTLTQWVSTGFYDKDRVQHAGWDMEDVVKTLPNVNTRSSGRMLRLDF